MKRWVAFFALSICGFLNSCSCVAIAHVENASLSALTVIVEKQEIVIAPGETKKIRGIYYTGATVVLPDEERLSFDKAFELMLGDWPNIQQTHICTGIFCAKFSLQWTAKNEFLLLGCDESIEQRVLKADQVWEPHRAT